MTRYGNVILYDEYDGKKILQLSYVFARRNRINVIF